jgi:hypothetical protein
LKCDDHQEPGRSLSHEPVDDLRRTSRRNAE